MINKKIFSQHNIKFKYGITSANKIPKNLGMEIAIIGRSNVGKSSLINALSGNTSLARTSKTPGCTAQINFFQLQQYPCYLVDLPGYGYAKRSKKELQQWEQLIEAYIKNNSRIMLVLIDSRRGLKELDIEMLEFTRHYGIACKIIFTKIDKIKKTEHEELLINIKKQLQHYPNVIENAISTSSSKKLGINELQTFLLDIFNSYNE